MSDTTMASHIKDSIADAGSAVRETLHTGRLSAADALHSASKGLHAKADRVGQMGHNAADAVNEVGDDAADRIESASKYVRSHGAERLMSDVERFVKRNPGKSLLMAAVVGYFAGRMLRRND